MLLESLGDKSKWKHALMQCDTCDLKYEGRIVTYLSQINKIGINECRFCSSRRAGKKTALKMSQVYSQWYSGDGNPSKKPGIGKKISDAKRGKKLSEKHKKALCKPKSKTAKIKEAANRPEEVKRRTERMLKNNPSKKLEVRQKISNTISNLMISGDFQRSLDKGWVFNNKTLAPIWCRSGLEKKFLDGLEKIDSVLYVESAEYLKIPYEFNGSVSLYLPDFRVVFKHGRDVIVEVKNSYLLTFERSIAKKDALEKYCDNNGKQCLTLNEKEIEKWLEVLKE